MICAALAFTLLCASAWAAPEDPIVRLHVVADSDLAEAQALKLEIRDAVLEEARSLLASCQDADAAWEMVNAHLDSFLSAAELRMRELHQNLPLTAQAGVLAFPDREYDGLLVPAGDYRALRIVIGSGEGQNWWCVLFPNLCLPGGERHSILAGWLSDLFGGEAS